MLTDNIKGYIYGLHKSKINGNWIAYTDYGKVILFKNHKSLHAGFVEITSVEDKGKCFLATGKNVVKDFYYGYENDEVIPYDEFKEVLKLYGFVPEYEEKIDEDDYFYVWANLECGSIITIETWSKGGEKTYNSVNMYIPTHSLLAFEKNIDRGGFSHGGWNVCCFNLVFCKYEFPIEWVLHLSDKKDISWKGDVPSLWSYGTEMYEVSDFIENVKKLYKFKDKDLWKKFGMDVDGYIQRFRKIEERNN